LLHHVSDKKRTERAVDIVRQLEHAGHFPQAQYAFAHGLFTLELTRCIESVGKHWVSELECSRHIQWQGQWQRLDTVATGLRESHPESFRRLQVRVEMARRSSFGALPKSSGSIRGLEKGCPF
jgi:hypothetical protein